MSLKEEIKNEIDLATREKRISPSNYTQLTNEILKLIEKRIDSIGLSTYPIGNYGNGDLNTVEEEMIEKFKELLK